MRDGVQYLKDCVALLCVREVAEGNVTPDDVRMFYGLDQRPMTIDVASSEAELDARIIRQTGSNHFTQNQLVCVLCGRALVNDRGLHRTGPGVSSPMCGTGTLA